jgi:hypothetical protein
MTLNATSDSGLPVTYTVVSGPATVNGSTLTFTGSGTVVVRVAQAGDARYDGASADVTINATPIPRLVNISARARVSAKDANGATIAGFVVTGTDPKPILIRAIGPGLAKFGLADALSDPRLTLYDSANHVTAANAGWNDNAAVAAAGASAGAFALEPGSKDAAILATLAPGAYTAQVQSEDSSGTVLVEVYDVTANASVPTKQLVNLSTRGVVGVGTDALIGGFVVSGDEPKRILIRAVGPGLSTYGVTDVLMDPVLTLYNDKGSMIAANDNWSAQVAPATEADIQAAASATGAFPLASGSGDSALVLTLEPGAYTAVVTGVANTGGNALVEVYELPSP